MYTAKIKLRSRSWRLQLQKDRYKINKTWLVIAVWGGGGGGGGRTGGGRGEEGGWEHIPASKPTRHTERDLFLKVKRIVKREKGKAWA